jgi:hypothetical protein
LEEHADERRRRRIIVRDVDLVLVQFRQQGRIVRSGRREAKIGAADGRNRAIELTRDVVIRDRNVLHVVVLDRGIEIRVAQLRDRGLAEHQLVHDQDDRDEDEDDDDDRSYVLTQRTLLSYSRPSPAKAQSWSRAR